MPLGFLSAIAVLSLATPTPTLVAWGSAVAACGEALRIWAAGHLNKSREVTRSGPYRYFAHPLYVGSSVLGMGLAVASASLIVAILIGVYLAATITAAVRTEESFLRSRFGDAYQRYKAGDTPAATRRFSLERAFANGEHRTLAGIAAAILLLALKATYNVLFWRTAGR